MAITRYKACLNMPLRSTEMSRLRADVTYHHQMKHMTHRLNTSTYGSVGVTALHRLKAHTRVK